MKLLLLLWAPLVYSIGMVIDPVLEGDTANYSGPKNLNNCLSYHTNDDDLVMVRVLAGNRVASQNLNIKISDSEDNLLRYTNDILGEVIIITKNLNNKPVYDANNQRRDAKAGKIDRLLQNNQGRNLVHICFDNIYSDKSWSFLPQPREIDLQVHLRDVSTMRHTDYNLYSKYFHKFQTHNNEDNKIKSMSEMEFDAEIKVIENELNDVVENLKNSELILQNILDQESKLRATNESIFSTYSTFSIVIFVIIIAFGLSQSIYIKRYLSRMFPYNAVQQ